MSKFSSLILLFAISLSVLIPETVSAQTVLRDLEPDNPYVETLNDREPTHTWHYTSELDSVIDLQVTALGESLRHLEVYIFDAESGTVLGEGKTAFGAKPMSIMIRATAGQQFEIRLSKGSSVGGGEYQILMEVLPASTVILASRPHDMGKQVRLLGSSTDGFSLIRSNFNLCHDNYSPMLKDLGWGIVWYRYASDDQSKNKQAQAMRFFDQAGQDVSYDFVFPVMPNAVSFAMIPPTALAVAINPRLSNGYALDSSAWNPDIPASMAFDNIYRFSRNPTTAEMSVDIQLLRHHSSAGEAPYLHHSIDISLTNIGNYDISRQAGGMLGFAVYNSHGELVDMGGIIIRADVPLGVDETTVITMSSISQTGSCVQPYDPEGHEIWIGVTFTDNNRSTVFNAFEVFPIGTVPFEYTRN